MSFPSAVIGFPGRCNQPPVRCRGPFPLLWSASPSAVISLCPSSSPWSPGAQKSPKRIENTNKNAHKKPNGKRRRDRSRNTLPVRGAWSARHAPRATHPTCASHALWTLASVAGAWPVGGANSPLFDDLTRTALQQMLGRSPLVEGRYLRPEAHRDAVMSQRDFGAPQSLFSDVNFLVFGKERRQFFEVWKVARQVCMIDARLLRVAFCVGLLLCWPRRWLSNKPALCLCGASCANAKLGG